ncbi:hypothetical protein TTRE_0000937301 [Trichuris trichiura]|uniref:Uncharacterized protein n=1 Tax=Trichuris trichiura TaxID=36087 RepID=A0A077ZQC4_TRITR|nr:hypothetical protein TTRE_0000937301 [Trichuris trichiura]
MEQVDDLEEEAINFLGQIHNALVGADWRYILKLLLCIILLLTIGSAFDSVHQAMIDENVTESDDDLSSTTTEIRYEKSDSEYECISEEYFQDDNRTDSLLYTRFISSDRNGKRLSCESSPYISRRLVDPRRKRSNHFSNSSNN